MAKLNVLSTKKLEPSLLALAESRGVAITEQEAVRIKPILSKEKWDEIFSLLQENISHAVFTSSNAVQSLKRYLNTYVNHFPVQWKIFCLSGKTAEVLQENEELFGTIEATAANAADLATEIVSSEVKEVVFFCGNKRRDELPIILLDAGVQVHESVVYETIELPVASSGDFDAVLFFSPSAVQSFFSVNQLKDSAVCFAIGKTTAESIEQFTANKIYTSKEPSQEALLSEVFHFLKLIGDSQH